MFTKILIGVDGGTGGRDALRLAQELAGPDTGLVMGHVWEDGAGVAAAALSTPHPAPVAEALLEAERVAAGVDCAVAVRSARSTAAGLHQLAEELGCDLIVTGSPASARTGHVGLAGHAITALHGAPCALAVAPRGYAAASGSLHAIGVGFEETPLGEQTLARTRLLGEQLGGELHLMSVVTPVPLVWMSPPMAYLAQLEELAHDRVEGVRDRLAELQDCTVDVVRGEPVLRLREFSARVDLLVLGSRSYGPVHRLLLGSTSDGLVHDAACPVLVLAHPGVAAPVPA